MKLCEVIIGPIMGNGGVIYYEGEEIVLEDATAALFESWGYVQILGDADDGSSAAGRAAATGLGGFEVAKDLTEPDELPPLPTRKSKTTTAVATEVVA
jgi:hypothetical protein